MKTANLFQLLIQLLILFLLSISTLHASDSKWSINGQIIEQETNESNLSYLTDETYLGVYIDYSKYDAAILRDYEGSNIEQLDVLVTEFDPIDESWICGFSLFGAVIPRHMAA